MSLSLTAVRFYTQLDPYFYTVDNRPLSDLETRDNQLSAELDRRTLCCDITGSATPTTTQIPAGWTVTSGGTGIYTVTHNLGYATYIANITVVDSTGGTAVVSAFTTTTITIRTYSTGTTLAHKRFHMMVTGY